jgi:DNA-directed RNA polymerase III subunit RPC8
MYTLVSVGSDVQMPLQNTKAKQVTIADVVQILPKDFSKPSSRAIEDFINAKYADKVIHKIGLCVGFHSLISASEGLIGHGTGIVNVNVDFRLIVFRPFKGEIIRGSIAHSTEAGLHMSMGFFEDTYVASQFMFSPSTWEVDETGQKTWIWHADGEPCYFDRLEKCLMRVEQEKWHDLSPQMRQSVDADDEGKDEKADRPSPYKLVASMTFSGLGPDLWWLGEEGLAQEAKMEALQANGDDAEMTT